MGALKTLPDLLEMPNRRQFNVAKHALGTQLNSAHAKAVLLVLATVCNGDGWCYMGSERLAREANVEPETLRKVRRILQEIGLLTHVRLSKAEMAELRCMGGDGAFREEEWQLSLGLLGADLRDAYERCRVQHSGKVPKVAGDRGKAKPGPKVVAAPKETVAAAKYLVAATTPPNPLLGGTTIEPERTTTHARAVDSAVALVTGSLGVAKLIAVQLHGVVAEQLEVHAAATGQTAAQVAALMVANHREAYGVQGCRMGLARWIGEGHWKYVQAKQANAAASRPRSERADVGVFRGEIEPMTAQELAEAAASNEAWKQFCQEKSKEKCTRQVQMHAPRAF